MGVGSHKGRKVGQQVSTVKDMKLLGLRVCDLVTGFTGIVSSISYDLYGCVQAVVTPGVSKDGKAEDGRWFDTKRLTVLDPKPVMEVPCFEEAVTSVEAAPVKTIPGGQKLPRQERY